MLKSTHPPEGPLSSDQQPGIRAQLGRAISLVFAPSGQQETPKTGEVPMCCFSVCLPWLTPALPVLQVPESSLMLEFVYGYDGNQQHDNLFFNSMGHLVYGIAAKA